MKTKLTMMLALAFALLFSQSAFAQSGGLKDAGPGVQYEYQTTLSVEQMRTVLTAYVYGFMAGPPESPFPPDQIVNKLQGIPKYPVKIYKVYYNSVIPELGNQPIRATGMVAIPDIKDARLPMVSYQHGTVFEKDAVPSSLDKSYETQFMVATFASQGYVVIGADYFGLGETFVKNTFFVPGSTEQACIDMLFASRAVLKTEGKQASNLFLNGWSQGGYNTFRFLKRLEMMGEKVSAASTAAAPTDLRIWISRLMINPQPGDAPWLVSAASNLIMATDAYALPGLAQQAIKPKYLDAARKFYNFEITFGQFYSQTPSAVKDFFTTEFIESAKYGNTPFWNLMEKYENYRWKVSTPFKNFYGNVDEAVPPGIASLPSRIAPLFGSTTTAVAVGDLADHRATYLYSLTEIPAFYKQYMK